MRISNALSAKVDLFRRFSRATYRLDPTSGLPNLISPKQHVRFFRAISVQLFPSLKYKKIRDEQKLFENKYLKPLQGESGYLGTKKQHRNVIPKFFFQLSGFSTIQIKQANTFLVLHCISQYSPEKLWSHMDSQGDIEGKILDSLLAIRDLEQGSENILERSLGKPKLIFDARSLQDPGLRDRGIGVFAIASLNSIVELSDSFEIILLTDNELPLLAQEFINDFSVVTSLAKISLCQSDILVQPSPLTSSPVPLVPALISGIRSIAIVYDFIPANFPSIYLGSPQQITQYSAGLKALKKYNTLIAISQSVAQEIKKWVPDYAGQVKVCWPRNYLESVPRKDELTFQEHKELSVTIISGAEPRKNLFNSLKALRNIDCNINILGMSIHPHQVTDFANALGIQLDRIKIIPRVSETTKQTILRTSSLVLVLAYAEGLSLPVIEGIIAGVPVLASDIPPHRDLLGDGFWLVNLKKYRKLEETIREITQKSKLVVQAQTLAFESILPVAIEGLLQTEILIQNQSSLPKPVEAEKHVFIHNTNAKINIGVCTPWAPLKTGVADYSMATLPFLTDYCDLTIYRVGNENQTHYPAYKFESINRAYVMGARHHALLSVMGNSFYHLPVYHFLKRYGGHAICHDSAMLDFYDELNGVSEFGDSNSPTANSRIRYEHFGELENLNFADLANSTDSLIFHNQSIALRVADETRSTTDSIRFIPMRVPSPEWLEQKNYANSKQLKISSKKTWNVITLGFLSDSRKLSNVLVEACMWLRQWGVDTNLTFVGAGPQEQIDLIYRSVGDESTSWIKITGFVDENTMIKYISEADYFVQLRLGDVPMMSGPTFDAAAFGLRGVVTPNLSDSQSLPSYISVTEDNVSPLILAKKMYEDFMQMPDWSEINLERNDFVSDRTPQKYAEELVEKLSNYIGF